MSLIHFDNENFYELISSGKVLVDFYANWCGPCKMIGPILEEIAMERNDVTIVKVDVDNNSDLAVNYGVMSIPTMILFNDGVEVNKHIGFLPKEEIINLIENK